MMGQQMELFNEGGLKDEGGSKDPISGNDVPIGSLKKEVRDDIPAQLSEGEFVFPADVVRYYGLDTLMKMRQKAKQGLKLMEAMGQMGNSEEAIVPDDIPFNFDDLEIEDDGLEFNVGGFTEPATVQPPMVVNPAPRLPTVEQPKLTFTDLMPTAGTPGQSVPMEFVNEDGQTVVIPSVGGKPLYPPPPGFKPKGEAPADKEEVTTQTTTTSSPIVSDSGSPSRSATASRDVVMPTTMDTPKSPTAYQVGDYRDYLARRSPAGSMGIDYAGDISGDAPITSTLAQNRITRSGRGTKTFPLDPSSGITGKAGDIVDASASKLFGGTLTGDTAIRANAAKRLKEGRYASEDEFNVLRNTVDLAPQKTLFNMKGVDDPDLAKDIAQAKTVTYKPEVAKAQADRDSDFQEKLRAEEAKNPSTTNVEMTRMMIQNNPTRDAAISSGESNSAREERERKEADEMRRAAALDERVKRSNAQRAEQNMNVNNDNDSGNDTSGSDYSEPSVGGGDGTHCCTASYKRKSMTIKEVKELRQWHRKQSQIWQDGYDVWGKVIADKLVAKSDWSASVVKAVYDCIIKKKLTLKGLFGIIVINLGVYPIGLLQRIKHYGRTLQSN